MLELKNEFARYNKIMPIKNATIRGEVFPYRYYKNDQPEKDVTLIFLAGGTGLADAVFLLFGSLIDRYSLLTFNYPQAFKTNADLADALAELIQRLEIRNVYLVGQSYGGLFAQVMAKRHPEVVKGLILSGTCSMYNDLSYDGISNIVKFINPKKLKRNLRIDKHLPTKLLPFILKLVFKKVARDEKTARDLSEIVELLKESITRKYWYHMDILLGDLMNEYGTHKPEDFISLKNEVLIMFSKDDKIFIDELKEALIRLMPQPVVITDIEGGHLALVVNPEEYMKQINTFISERN
jgi:pimeloyl-ACP methyl ester carboxylesterase